MTTQGPLDRLSPIVVLFCDIADIGRIVNEHGAEWAQVFPRYQELVWAAIEGAGGCVEDGESASFFGSFREPVGAVRAAGAIQRAMANLELPEGLEVQARVGVHAGVLGETISHSAHTRPQFEGLDVHRGARVRGAARPGQVIVSGVVRDLIKDEMHAGRSRGHSDRRVEFLSSAAGADETSSDDLTSRGPEEFSFEDLGYHRLRDFPESVRLFNLVVFDDRRAEYFGSPDTLDYRPTNLTADDRPLLGRDELIEMVRSAFLDEYRRFITLTGPGGVGKTRLAIAAGSELLEEHRGGVWLVRAETLKETHELVPAIATVLGVRDVPGQDLFDTVIDRVELAPMVLVIDNVEQLAHVGEFVSELLDRTVSVRVLVTSQTPLRVNDESIVAVPVLCEADAVDLFCLSAVGAGRVLDLNDRAVNEIVIRVTDRLDRLPLAIELAAAQLHTLNLFELLRSVESQLDLQATQTGKPERQQSLKAVINWSVQALPLNAKTLFTRLGVFSGLIPLELIEEVCATPDINVIEAAATLVDFSLLRRTEGWFGMPPAIQQTASERLDGSAEKPALQRAHAVAMTERALVMRDLEPQIYRDVSELNPNFDAAVNWARTSDPQTYAVLVSALSRWWRLSGRITEAISENSSALQVVQLDDNTRAALFKERADLFVAIGDAKNAVEAATRAVGLLGESPSLELGLALLKLSVAQGLEDPSAAASSASRAAKVMRGLGNTKYLVDSLCLQAQAIIGMDQAPRAEAILQEAASVANNETGVYALSGLSHIKGDWALAMDRPLQALAAFADALQHEWSNYLILFHTAGVVSALSELREFESEVELFVALERISQELGVDPKVLRYRSDWSERIKERRDQASFAEAQERGRRIERGQLAARATQIANTALKRHSAVPNIQRPE